MSKSLGNGVDPLSIIDEYGADAARFAVLSAGSIMQQEIRIAGYERAEEGRSFAQQSLERLSICAAEPRR